MAVWKSSRGLIEVSDMDDSHLVNTIKLLQRQAYQERSNLIVQASISLTLRTGTLKDVFETDILEFVPGVYYAMVDEANLRNIWYPREPPAPIPPYVTPWDTEEEEAEAE